MVAPSAVLPTLPTSGAGPTVMSRVAGGYELRNHAVRVVIDGQSGDVVEWAAVGHAGNVAGGGRGIHPALVGLPDVPPVGLVQKRDDQTWQYVGTDANGVTWRKVYDLDHDGLLVSYVIANDRSTPMVATVAVVGDVAGRVTVHTAEQFTAVGPVGTVSLSGWDVAHGGPPPAVPVLLRSDAFPLKAGERQGYTTEWRLYPID